MTFEESLQATIRMLERQGRVSYRAIRRQCDIDEECLEDLKFELTDVLGLADDQNGTMLVWRGALSPLDSLAPGPAPLAAPLPVTPPPNRASPSSAERRQLTVMFCDVVGSTPLAEAFDPEDFREIIQAYQEAVGAAVKKFDGFIARYLGDGLLIYFGYPQAHEDDARRAVSSGLRIREEIAQLNTQLEHRWGVRLQVRIGVHTGLVVIGDMGVAEALDPMAIVGETPNIAARLQSLAEPGALVISEATYRLIHHYFRCQSLGTPSLKGVSELLTLYAVQGESTARSRFDVAVQDDLISLVGRKSEVQILREQWQEALNGQMHGVLVQAEAGMGKSRLLWELKQHVLAGADQKANAMVLECVCSPYTQNSAFYPLIDLLERSLRVSRDDTLAKRFECLKELLVELALDPATYAALLASLLSLPLPDDYPPLTLTPERQRQKTIEALTTLFLARAAQNPLLLVVEDLHWIDASTLEVLTYLFAQEPTHALLVMVTARPEFQPPWEGQVQVRTLPLANLAQADTLKIVEQLAGGKRLPREVTRQIVEKTDGIPLFVEELTKTILESGLLQERGGQYELTTSASLLTIPATLHDSLIARLDRLAPIKEVAQLGAALGREFTYDLIAAVSLWDEPTLREGLSQLVQSGLLFQTGNLPTARYRFKHALVQDTAYQSLLKSRRQQYHLHIAQVLETAFPEVAAAQPELIAQHLARGGRAETAISFWQRAAERALARVAYSEAVVHLKDAIAVAQNRTESAEQELGLRMLLGPALMALQGYSAPEVRENYVRAGELSGQVPDAPQTYGIQWGLWAYHFVGGDLGPARERGEQIWQFAQRTSDPHLIMASTNGLGYTLCYQAEYENCLRVAEEGLSLFSIERERAVVAQFQLSMTSTIVDMSRTALWMLGFPDQARERHRFAETYLPQLAHPISQVHASASSTWFYPLGYDTKQLLTAATVVEELSQEGEFSFWPVLADIFRGWALAYDGQTEVGIREMQEKLDLYLSIGGGILHSHASALLAEILLEAGRPDAARETLQTALTRIASSQERHMEPELYRLTGECILRQGGASDEAEQWFRRALDLAASQKALWLELKTALSLARWREKAGKLDEARETLAPIYSRMTEGFDTQEMIEAKSLLARL